MATHSIGKLKFNLSGDGLAYRWGEGGKTHRLFQGRRSSGAEDDNSYEDQPEGDALQDRYDADDRYADDDGYDDDDRYDDWGDRYDFDMDDRFDFDDDWDDMID